MGSWKLLLPCRGSTVIGETTANALKAADRVILVSGHRAPELEKIFADTPRVTVVRNPDYLEGMFSSIRAGAAAVEAGFFFITMGDLPSLSPEIFLGMIEHSKLHREFEVWRPLYRGLPSHPVLCSSALVPTILSKPNSSCMKEVLAAHPVMEIPMDLPESFFDLDTPEDYQRARGS